MDIDLMTQSEINASVFRDGLESLQVHLSTSLNMYIDAKNIVENIKEIFQFNIDISVDNLNDMIKDQFQKAELGERKHMHSIGLSQELEQIAAWETSPRPRLTIPESIEALKIQVAEAKINYNGKVMEMLSAHQNTNLQRDATTSSLLTRDLRPFSSSEFFSDRR